MEKEAEFYKLNEQHNKINTELYKALWLKKSDKLYAGILETLYYLGAYHKPLLDIEQKKELLKLIIDD